ncbi:MAG: hypothetical protein WA973_14845 [Mesorhizobium sp.]
MTAHVSPPYVNIPADLCALHRHARTLCWLTEQVERAFESAKKLGLPEFETFADLATEQAYLVKREIESIQAVAGQP